MDATIIVPIVVAVVMSLPGIYTAFFSTKKEIAEITKTAQDAAVDIIEPLRGEVKIWREEVIALRKQVRELEGVVELKNKRIQELENILAERDEKINCMEEEITQLRKRINEVDTRMDDVEKRRPQSHTTKTK